MFQEEAIHVLSHHQLTPHGILTRLRERIEHVIQLPDHKNRIWTFVMRVRCGLYLMAKTESMKYFEELYHLHD